MLLTLDIGNTNIKSALFDDNFLIEFIIHSKVNEVIRYAKNKNLIAIAVCSVNPSVEESLANELSEKNIELFRANIKNKFNLRVKYETPDTLGMDRVCSTVGAYDIAVNKKLLLKSQFLLTIDFGTATTINIVSPEAIFLGGLIAPGIKTMLKSLNEKTAQLPLPEPVTFQELIGDSTNSSILSGVYNATTGMINETFNHLKKISKNVEPIIFAAGGYAKVIMPYIKHPIIYEEALVLKGLKVIYDLNK
jgi:type III pantothenate kinase